MYGYEAVGAGASDQVLGDTAAGVTGAGKGQRLHMVIVSVETSATGTSSIKDGGGSAIPLTYANTPIGVYPLLIDAISESGPWKVTTGAGATVLAVGNFKS